jgi:hypothetical protein
MLRTVSTLVCLLLFLLVVISDRGGLRETPAAPAECQTVASMKCSGECLGSPTGVLTSNGKIREQALKRWDLRNPVPAPAILAVLPAISRRMAASRFPRPDSRSRVLDHIRLQI